MATMQGEYYDDIHQFNQHRRLAKEGVFNQKTNGSKCESGLRSRHTL